MIANYSKLLIRLVYFVAKSVKEMIFKKYIIMNTNPVGYNLFFRFIEKFTPSGFQSIDRDDPLIIRIEEMTHRNNQFFHISDLVGGNLLFTSERSLQMTGIPPDELNPFHFFEVAHPDEVYKYASFRSKIINLANDLYIARKGSAILSINIRIRNSEGKYQEHVFQSYMFYTDIPFKTVFILQVHSNIESFKIKKHGYHYYAGNDLSYFRYPDEELLLKGYPLSSREFEVVRLASLGLQSDQIAEKLFLSVYTVNTHRRNILVKSGKSHISNLIYDLSRCGVL